MPFDPKANVQCLLPGCGGEPSNFNFARHVHDVHPKLIEPHACPVFGCRRLFGTEAERDAHFRTVHGGQAQCGNCNHAPFDVATEKQRQNYAYHVATCHKLPRFEC